jgi:hypothetical protein
MNEGKASDTDVTERVKEAIKADKNDEFKKTLKFPEKVTEVLKKTVGVWQNELEEDDASQSEGNTDGVKSSSVEDYISTYLNDIFEKEKEVADALKTSKGYTSICEYCNYKKICRRKI